MGQTAQQIMEENGRGLKSKRNSFGGSPAAEEVESNLIPKES